MTLFANNMSTRKTLGKTILKKNKMGAITLPFQDLFYSYSNHKCVVFVER